MSGLLLLLAAGRGAHSGTGEWLSGRMEELVNGRMCVLTNKSEVWVAECP